MHRFFPSVFIMLVLLLSTGARDKQSSEQNRSQDDYQLFEIKNQSSINRKNIKNLGLAWSYDSGDEFEGSELEATPIIADGTVYVVSPTQRVVAIDAITGTQKWIFDPHSGRSIKTKRRSRGVSYWRNGHEARIFANIGQYIYALNAATGLPEQSFGDHGRVDMAVGIERDPREISISNPSPGTVYKDLIIEGSSGQVPGDIRAYDVRSGKILWTFHTIPHPGEPGYETWPSDAWSRANGANAWSGFSLDITRGIVYAATGSGGSGDRDFYGADRLGNNLYSNSVLALDAASGKLLWHYQLVHHDLWDRDLPSPPTLVTLKRQGIEVPALIQITKAGLVFVLNRETGKPIFPIEERPVPASDIVGEVASPTQPFPTLPAPFARQHITEQDLTTRTHQAHESAVKQFRSLRSNGQFTPPSLQGTLLSPGFDGGGEYGGVSFDPVSQTAYINSNNVAAIIQLVERDERQKVLSRRDLYLQQCASCHGADLGGSPPSIPSLKGIAGRMSVYDVSRTILYGGGRMPSFAKLGGERINALSKYVIDQENLSLGDGGNNSPDQELGRRFSINGYQSFKDIDGYPAVKPPWGLLSALDLKSGRYRWQVPFGEYPELKKTMPGPTGSENYGGSVLTSTGVLFIGATIYDNKFRAIDTRNGRELWSYNLPAAALGTPLIYRAAGEQYVVVAAGGGKNPKTKTRAVYMAFKLGAPGSKVQSAAERPNDR